MEAQGWRGAPNDTGAFGTEVHRQVALKLAVQDPNWVANVYVSRSTNKIVSVGNIPPGGVTGTTQVDLVYVRNGQNVATGQLFDPNKIEDLVEIKTSIGGKINADQLGRLKTDLMGGREIVVTEGTARKWTPAKGWHANAKFQNAFRLLSLLGAASAVWNIIHSDQYDELDAIVAEAKYIHDRPYAAKFGGNVDLYKRLDLLDFQTMTTNYLKHFCPDGTVLDIIQLRASYKVLGDLDVSATASD